MKEKKQKKEKLNDGHYLEAMDRLHLITSMMEEHLLNHPVFKEHKDLRKLVKYSIINLSEAYQRVGQKDYERDERKNPIKQIVFGRHQDTQNGRVDDCKELRGFREPH